MATYKANNLQKLTTETMQTIIITCILLAPASSIANIGHFVYILAQYNQSLFICCNCDNVLHIFLAIFVVYMAEILDVFQAMPLALLVHYE